MMKLAASAALLVALLATAGPVAAYDPNAAAAYADQWAQSRNSNYPNLPDDCTNFVSQALRAGGYPMSGVGYDETKYLNWWVLKGPQGTFSWSFSWTVSSDLLNMLYYDYPGGFPVVYKSPSQQGSGSASSGGAKGDVLFYDWGANDTGGYGIGVSHATIQVGHGTDPDSLWVGDYVDEHTRDRKHAFWSLKPYNADRASTTYITVVHVSPNN
jgi:hypothetical protein